MGKIFGISDLPVTIFTTPLEPIRIPKFVEFPRRILGENYTMSDVLVIKNSTNKNGVLHRLINGFLNIGKK